MDETDKSVRWHRVLIEGAVIVTSILMAFGIQAWWDDHTERSHEGRVLAALLMEFQENDELLGSALGWYEQQYMEAVQILELIESRGDEGLAEEELRSILSSVTQKRSFHLESGAHEALLAAGDLDLIRDEALRSRLASWPSFVAEWSEEEVAAFSFVDDHVVPYLAGRVRLRNVSADFPSFSAAPRSKPARSNDFTVPADIIRDATFDNLVYRRSQGLWHAMRDGQELRSQAETILDLIRGNLDG